MLSRLDEYPVHQTPEPLIRRATSDRNAYDRYWFNGLDRDGGFYFGLALGLYPNRGVMDASFSIARDGVQHAFHGSRRAPREPTDTQVGPFSLEIVEPMREIRVCLAPNETGISCDLRFRSRTPALEEERTTRYQDERVMMDMTRYTQFGRWQGWIEAGALRTEVGPAHVYGTRDRSWGIRPVGEPVGGRPGPLPQVAWLWAPIHFDDECTLVGYFQNPGGEIWYADGMRVPASDAPEPTVERDAPGLVPLRPTATRPVFRPGSRWIDRAAIDVEPRGGPPFVLELETILRFWMKGLGYGHPEWGHGLWKGEEAIGGESWKLDEVDPRSPFDQHVHNLVRARVGDRTGVGNLEQIILGPHEGYGFKELLDVAD